MRFAEAARDQGCGVRWSRRARTAGTCSSPPASTSLRGAHRRRGRRARRARGQAGPPTRSWRVPGRSGRASAMRGVRGRPGRRRGAGRAGSFGWVVGVDRSGQAEARAPRRRRGRGGPRRAAGAPVIPTTSSRSRRGRCRSASSTSTCSPRRSRSSRSPTATSGCAGTSTRGAGGRAGTYLNGFCTRHAPYAEQAYGYPEDGQTMINVTNGKVMRRWSTTSRSTSATATCRATSGCSTSVRACCAEVEGCRRRGRRCSCAPRDWSPVQRSVAAILYEVEPVEHGARVVVQSELVANEAGAGGDRGPACRPRPPRPAGERGPRPRRSPRRPRPPDAESGLRMAAGMDHVVEGPDGTVTATESEADLAWCDLQHRARPGQVLTRGQVRRLRMVEPAIAAIAARPGRRGARLGAADGLGRALPGPAKVSDGVWERADVELEGDRHLQQATRFALFRRPGGRPRRGARDPAKGLTGSGYDGHSFWDMETYTLPVLTYVAPEAARDALGWRHATIDLAEARARELGLEGATFPWRTIRGQEFAGLLAGRHGGLPHQRADDGRRRAPLPGRHGGRGVRAGRRSTCWSPPRACGARWATTTRRAASGSTALPARRVQRAGRQQRVHEPDGGENLRTAAALVAHHPDRAAELGVDEEEIASWRDSADDGHPLRRRPEGDGAVAGVHAPGASGTRQDRGRPVPPLLHFHNYLLLRAARWPSRPIWSRALRVRRSVRGRPEGP